MSFEIVKEEIDSICITVVVICVLALLGFIIFTLKDCNNNDQKERKLLIEKCCPDKECCKDLIYKHLYPLKAQYPVEEKEE